MNMPALTRLDSPRIPSVVVAISYFLLISATLAKHGHDPSYLVAAGERFCDPDLVPKNPAVLSGTAGYDGQFCCRILFRLGVPATLSLGTDSFTCGHG
jgi:hypothetical protein